jgi:beta-phosphoglucomutase-like phosphatase (HAD superfamily)
MLRPPKTAPYLAGRDMPLSAAATPAQVPGIQAAVAAGYQVVVGVVRNAQLSRSAAWPKMWMFDWDHL